MVESSRLRPQGTREAEGAEGEREGLGEGEGPGAGAGPGVGVGGGVGGPVGPPQLFMAQDELQVLGQKPLLFVPLSQASPGSRVLLPHFIGLITGGVNVVPPS